MQQNDELCFLIDSVTLFFVLFLFLFFFCFFFVFFFSLLISFCLKFILSDINSATSDCVLCLLARNMFFHSFTLGDCVIVIIVP